MHNVFNGNISTGDILAVNNLSTQEVETILSELFEQLLIFDCIIIRTDRMNQSLIFLIKHLGINLVEDLIERRLIKFFLWTPVIVTGSGRRLDNGTIDESTIIGQPPLASGQLSNEDMDPENNIYKALSLFNIHRDRRRSFTRKAVKNYVIPEGLQYSSKSSEFIINAYKTDTLKTLGLPYNNEPENLNMRQRETLLKLGSKIIETSILSNYGYKSTNNYEHLKICQTSFENIGKAYNITENTSELFKLKDLPNLKSIFVENKLDFNSALKIRYYSNSKYFRNWINTVGESSDASEITKEYLKEIEGKNRFINTNTGKVVYSCVMFGVGEAIGQYFQQPYIGGALNLLLSQLDAFHISALLEGKTPAMFIDEIEYEVHKSKVEEELY